MAYDSSEDTWKHIRRIRELIKQMMEELHSRGVAHDASKLEVLEKQHSMSIHRS